MKFTFVHSSERRTRNELARCVAIRALVGAALVVIAFPIFAATTFCEKRANDATRNGADFRPAVESRVKAASGVWLHSAPHARCRKPGGFIKSGVHLPAYSLYRGWVYVMVVQVDGETPMGWIRERDLALLKPYGESPDNTPPRANAKMKVLQ